MPNYNYEAEHISGRKSEGIIPATSEAEARSKLQNLDLRVLKIEEKKDPQAIPETKPGLFAYEFQGERVDDQNQHKTIAGIIDAADRSHALERLRDEFRLTNIIILSEQAIQINPPKLSERAQIEKEVRDFVGGGAINKPKQQLPTIYSEILSFLSWLLLFEAFYYFYAILSQFYPLGMSATSTEQIITGPIFLISSSLLFTLFIIHQLYLGWRQTQHTLSSQLSQTSLYFLAVLGSSTIYLLSTSGTIDIISNLAALPLSTILILFLFTRK